MHILCARYFGALYSVQMSCVNVVTCPESGPDHVAPPGPSPTLTMASLTLQRIDYAYATMFMIVTPRTASSSPMPAQESLFNLPLTDIAVEHPCLSSSIKHVSRNILKQMRCKVQGRWGLWTSWTVESLDDLVLSLYYR